MPRLPHRRRGTSLGRGGDPDRFPDRGQDRSDPDGRAKRGPSAGAPRGSVRSSCARARHPEPAARAAARAAAENERRPVTQGPKRSAARIGVSRHESGKWDRRQDSVAVEEPMEIRLDVPATGGGAAGGGAEGGRAERGRAEIPVSVTMRTPGDDFLLVAGFLFGEGLVGDRRAIVDLRYCRNVSPQEYNVVTVTLRDPIDPASLTRNFYMTSSCGVCGKGSIEAVEVQGCSRLPRGELSLSAESILGMPEQVRAAQAVFEETGGLHAAGLFDAAGTL